MNKWMEFINKTESLNETINNCGEKFNHNIQSYLNNTWTSDKIKKSSGKELGDILTQEVLSEYKVNKIVLPLLSSYLIGFGAGALGKSKGNIAEKIIIPAIPPLISPGSPKSLSFYLLGVATNYISELGLF